MLNAELIGAGVARRGSEGTTEINKGTAMRYMWTVGLQNRRIGADTTTYFIQIPLGSKGQKARAECT
jgi:hypothetical protein